MTATATSLKLIACAYLLLYVPFYTNYMPITLFLFTTTGRPIYSAKSEVFTKTHHASLGITAAATTTAAAADDDDNDYYYSTTTTTTTTTPTTTTTTTP